MVAVPDDLTASHAQTADNEDGESTISGSESPKKEESSYIGGYIAFRIRDIADLSRINTFTCPASITFEEFFHDLCTKANLVLGEFEVVYQDPSGKVHELGDLPKNQTFSSINIVPDVNKVYSLHTEKKRVKRKSVARRLDAELEAVADAPVVQEQVLEPMQVDVCGGKGDDRPSFSEYKRNEELTWIFEPNSWVFRLGHYLVSQLRTLGFALKLSIPGNQEMEHIYCPVQRVSIKKRNGRQNGKEFVGLKNQSTTCYLNSLVQSLFFCPEFRNTIYNSVFEYDPKTKSLGLALQQLFLQMQFSVRGSVETAEITKTFGWKGDENTVQHDVEECYGILMDLLNDEFRKANVSSSSEGLFGGIMNDYVECLCCHKRNTKRELFLAIPLPVRMFGRALFQPTLEEALRTFVQPELLNEGNQYKCEECESLVDANKGLCFQKLPYIMCIQLKRSEYDFELMTRRKINDKLIFPRILNMNEFIDESKEEVDIAEFIPSIDVNVIQGPALIKRTTHSRPAVSLSEQQDLFLNEFSKNNIGADKNGGFYYSYSMTPEDLKDAEDALKGGRNVYQLISVLVHRGGSSLGGHYFVYVLDLEKNQWYRCNDSSVARISVSDIAETYGGYGRCEERDGIAYMLVYRKIDLKMNSLPLLQEQLPTHIKEMWKNLEIVDQDLHAQEEYERSIMRLPLYYRVPDTWDTIKKDVIISKASTIREACMQCYRVFFPDCTASENMVRLVRYNENFEIMDLSFDGRENDSVALAYRKPTNIEQNDAVMIELGAGNSSFEPYDHNDFVFKTYLVDLKSHCFLSTMEIHGRPGSKVGDLRTRIIQKFKLHNNNVTLIVKEKTGTRLWKDNDDFLSSSSLARVNDLFVSSVDSEQTGQLRAFVHNYYDSYHFEIECQLLDPSISDSQLYNDSMDTTFLTYCEVSEDLNFVEDDPNDFESLMQFQMNGCVEVVMQDDSLNEDSIQLVKDLSDHSASEGSSVSSTCSEQTLMGSESMTSESMTSESMPSNGTSPSRNDEKLAGEDFNSQPSCKEEEPCAVSKVIQPYFRVLDHKRSQDAEWSIFKVRAQMNMPIKAISRNISKLVSMDESRFIMYSVNQDLESEIIHTSGDLKGLQPFECIRTRIGHRLTKSEGRIGVYMLDLENYTDKPTFLKYVVLHDEMTVENVRSEITKELSLLSDFDTDLLKFFRLRKKVNTNPSRIMYDHMKITDFLPHMNGDLFVQPLKKPDECKEHGHTVMVRLWHPSELSLDPPKEFVIFYDYIISLDELLLENLVEMFSLTPENLEVANPDTEYPYDLNPLEIHEKLFWHQLSGFKRRHISIHNDEGVLFVRNKSESLKYISPEDRKIFEKESAKRRGEYVITPRKAEVGFKVNLARTPPT